MDRATMNLTPQEYVLAIWRAEYRHLLMTDTPCAHSIDKEPKKNDTEQSKSGVGKASAV